MKQFILSIMLFAFVQNTFAQNAMADLKFEEAEIAFNNQDYETTIKKLDEFDKVFGSVTSKSLYLRIVSQDKLFDKLFYISKIGIQIKNHEKGILITNVIDNGSAYKSGLKTNDIVIKTNDKEIFNTIEFIENVKYKDDQDELKILLIRGDEIINKIVIAEISKDITDENKIYFNDKNFDFLIKLRKNTNAYLKAMESAGLDDRYREVYKINKKLEKYPKDKAIWIREKQRIFNEKNQLIENENKRIVNERKLDVEIGNIISNYDVYPDLIQTNMFFEDLKTDRKGNLKQNEVINSYNYLRHNYSFSAMNPKPGLPEISEVLLDEENKVVGYSFLFIDGNRMKRNKSECDISYLEIKKKLINELNLAGDEKLEVYNYEDNSKLYIKFFYVSSSSLNNCLLLAYRFREYSSSEKKYNTAEIEFIKIPRSIETLNPSILRRLSSNPGANGYDIIYNLFTR